MVKKVYVIPPDEIDTTRHPGYPIGDNRSRDAFTWNLASKKGKIFQRVLKPTLIKMINKIHALILRSSGKTAFVYSDKRLQYLNEILHESIRLDFDHEQRKLDFMHKAVDIGIFVLRGKENKYLNAMQPVVSKTISKIHSWILKEWDVDAFVYDDPRMKRMHKALHKYVGKDAEPFVHDVIDIGLFMSKEDIYYRARMFNALNRIDKAVVATKGNTGIFPMLSKLPTFELTPEEMVNIDIATDGFDNISYSEREVLENAARDRIENQEIVG